MPPKYKDTNDIAMKVLVAHEKEEFEEELTKYIKVGWKIEQICSDTMPDKIPTQHPKTCWWALLSKRNIQYNVRI